MPQFDRRSDAVIVGAGPAGCLLAAVLAEHGRSVVVYEAGPPWQLEDLISSQIWSRRLKWGGPPIEKRGAHPIGYGFQSGWGFGGAALHHFAGWPRLRPQDFKLRTLYGRGNDWPIDYRELAPYYDRIQDEVGLSGDIDSEPWRPDKTPYPMPPLETFKQAAIIRRGFDALGKAVGPTPAAINSVPYRGRAACIYDGWCDAGCPIHALANPLVNYLPRAAKAGATFHSHCDVQRVLMSGPERAAGVEVIDGAGRRLRHGADVVVLAAAAVHNPRILFNSAPGDPARAPGNKQGLLGRYFFCHLVVSIYGLFEEETDNHLGLTVPALGSPDGWDKERTDGPFGSYGLGIAPALKPNDLLGIATSRADLFGKDLHAFMRRAVRHLGMLSGLCETVPERDNRVELGAKTDRNGLPLARIVNRHSENSIALWNHALEDGKAVMGAAGASEVWAGPMVTSHHLGGTIIGTDPEQAVANSYGQLFDVPNIVAAGGGLLPSCGSGSPTFTLHALGLRTAERMVSNWSQFTG